ncbi:MAG: hypothetical protein PF481_06730 [Bacteroidales bacterium]|nr:hypothetical protein [Bacteroidales bacterium]
MSPFLQNFKLSIPHAIKIYKNGETFLEDTFIQKSNPKEIHVIISEYSFSNNNNDIFFPLNGLDIYDIIRHTFPETTYVLLAEKSEIESASIPKPIISIVKNTNSHTRIKNTILSIYNKQNIITQKRLNIYLFSILGLISIFIVTYMMFLLL